MLILLTGFLEDKHDFSSNTIDGAVAGDAGKARKKSEEILYSAGNQETTQNAVSPPRAGGLLPLHPRAPVVDREA